MGIIANRVTRDLLSSSGTIEETIDRRRIDRSRFTRDFNRVALVVQ